MTCGAFESQSSVVKEGGQTDNVRVRFAPSPTGFLHLGGARTALFNWLLAQKPHTSHAAGGRFLLRVEDTDHARNNPEALSSILEGLEWLGLTADAPIVFQSKNAERHVEVAQALVTAGKAYWCFSSKEQTDLLKNNARQAGQAPIYPDRMLDPREQERKRSEAMAQGKPPVLRFKMPETGCVTFQDQVQNQVTVQADQLEDWVLLRSDGTPTYLLAVVVDDHDMAITHVVRGADHLSNTPKQVCVYQALGWTPPIFAHVPLIHGPDGAKLSKRHGAVDVRAYQKDGFVPQAVLNALLRLGWGHGDQEVFTQEEAIQAFQLQNIGRAPARFDPEKLRALNGLWMRRLPEKALLDMLQPFVNQVWARPWSDGERKRVKAGLAALAERSQTLKELAHSALIYAEETPKADQKAAKILTDEADARLWGYGQALFKALETEPKISWDAETLEHWTRAFAAQKNLKMKDIAQPLRVALTGRLISPPVFHVMVVLGPALVKQRLNLAES